VLGEDENSRLDVLKGDGDETSCTLKANIYKGCNLSPPLTSNATFETPASCTCNKVFFNIWTACSYSIGENLFPIFKDWMTICSSSGINLEQAQFLAERDNWGVNAPKWARIDVPGNLTMNLQSAVLTTQSKWSVLQIVLPFITALVATILAVLIMQLYHTRFQRASWRERMFRLVRPIPRVKSVDKYDAWEIEANDGAQYELVAPQSRPSDTYALGPKSPQEAQAQQPLQRGRHSKNNSEIFDGDDAGWGSVKNMRFPWKKDPNRVQEVHATTEFDIDEFNLTVDAGSVYSQNRPSINEADDLTSGAGQAATVNLVSRDSPSYSDPFSEQHR